MIRRLLTTTLRRVWRRLARWGQHPPLPVERTRDLDAIRERVALRMAELERRQG